MSLTRRQGLSLLASPLLATPALAQSFPARAVTIIVPLGPGSASDIMARALGQALQQAWGQPVVVDNRPGAIGTLGAAQVARAAPDGYTLLLAPPPSYITPMFMPNAGYDPAKDLKPISLLAYYPLVLTVNPAIPATNMREFIAWAKANPGATYGSPGPGSPLHLITALLAKQEGLDLVQVSYRTPAQGMTDTIAGILRFYPGPTLEVLPNIQAGRLRALATFDPRRSAALPDVPTAAEQGYPAISGSIWSMLMAPAGTPDAIMARLAEAATTAALAPAFRERMTQQGAEVVGLGQAESARYLAAEDARWRPLVRELGITVTD
ncbi:tripartite tricarboxylate transporter substrate binding protein [Rhodovarius crocodyli]|uniref:Tripartite tricarboxylate transporter substrate binding protein n=1 Tax=Rhodovarius crocodyli TaxID=1979269 RepID=A0A437MNN1_9PROT|nr:tripartite tricarboxylate transporter substrate binding protein [Rhodovarius crocodyli]RVT99232.1 tripartite tricarboxylate transporter substrate binding protein [Rhodovarius crocodyli]